MVLKARTSTLRPLPKWFPTGFSGQNVSDGPIALVGWVCSMLYFYSLHRFFAFLFTVLDQYVLNGAMQTHAGSLKTVESV